MKNIIFIVLSAFAFSAFADQDFSELPATIKCTSKAKSSAAKKFTIRKFNTEQPVSTISDASLENMDIIKGYKVNVGFSNECDNSYDLTFYKSDLIKLKSGKFHYVKGSLHYFDSYLSDILGEKVEDPNETVEAFCTL